MFLEHNFRTANFLTKSFEWLVRNQLTHLSSKFQPYRLSGSLILASWFFKFPHSRTCLHNIAGTAVRRDDTVQFARSAKIFGLLRYFCSIFWVFLAFSTAVKKIPPPAAAGPPPVTTPLLCALPKFVARRGALITVEQQMLTVKKQHCLTYIDTKQTTWSKVAWYFHFFTIFYA